MGKRKLIMGGLVFLIIMLCVMTIYLLRQNGNMTIAYNRTDRELIMLKADYSRLSGDYEKLYKSYYDYDKKILEILKFSDKVYWAEDSSAFCLYDGKETALFSFYKKPRMDGEYFLWPSMTGIDKIIDGTVKFNYSEMVFRVDTLKPNQFIQFSIPLPLVCVEVAEKRKEGLSPKDSKLLYIYIK